MGIQDHRQEDGGRGGNAASAGSDGAITDARVAKEFADRIGYRSS
jgi:hypothetical protein